MVQRKAPSKLASQAEAKKKEQQDSRSKRGGGDDHKKKLKKVKSIKLTDVEGLEGSVAIQDIQLNKPAARRNSSQMKKPGVSPNYMKPTSSSDARKERLQVRPSRSSANSNSKPCASFLPANKLARKTSLKTLLRTTMKKKSLSLASCSKKYVNRGTCSSTQKNSKFPEALDLNPGGTEAEGTSVLRVCPYSYCSLNGHSHPPLPPLKCFLSARRRAIKAQKDMKVRVMSSGKVRSLEEDEKGTDTGQTEISCIPAHVEIIPLIEEGNDFFVEIYAKPQESFVGTRNCEEYRGILKQDGLSVPEVVNSLSINEGDLDQHWEGENETETVCKTHEENLDVNSGDFIDDQGKRADVTDDGYGFGLHEFNLGVNFEDDQHSSLSVDEMDFMMKFLEYVECDQQVDEHEEENGANLVQEDSADLCAECCCMNTQSKDGESVAESKAEILRCGDTEVSWDKEIVRDIDHMIDYSEDSENENSGDAFAFEQDKTLLIDEIDGSDAELLQEITVLDEENGVEDNNSLLEIELNDSCQYFTGSEEDADVKNKDNNCVDATEDPGTQTLNQFGGGNKGMQPTDVCGDEEIKLRPIEGDCDPMDDILEINESDTFVVCSMDSSENLENNEAISNTKEDTDRSVCETDSKEKTRWNINRKERTEDSEEKTRWNIIRKERAEESEDISDYNQRGPNFLPIEPDPEGEKVDLRHQMLDERKNAEEWMIDCALQRAVTKLAPARKKKVALLVEAFETVKPLPMYQAPLQDATSSFSQGSPIQACS